MQAITRARRPPGSKLLLPERPALQDPRSVRYDAWRRKHRMPSRKAGRPGARILRSQEIYKGPVFGVRRDEVREPTGVRVTREVITHPGSVVVRPVLPGGRIVLVRQYRHATRLYTWELVAGRT